MPANPTPAPPAIESAEQSDAEVICTFMETKPISKPGTEAGRHDAGRVQWWVVVYHKPPYNGIWAPPYLSLDKLYAVEARLTDEQPGRYAAAIYQLYKNNEAGIRDYSWLLLHLTAAQKIAALAEVIRRTKPDEVPR